jgi:hypothetical protein
LVSRLAFIFRLQAGYFFITQLSPHLQPGGDDTRQAEGILSIQVYVYPLVVSFLSFQRGNFSIHNANKK